MPGRLAHLLAALVEMGLGARRLVVCRELTKMHEETIRGSIAEIRARLAEAPKGEITVVVEGKAPRGAAVVDVEALVDSWQRDGLSTKEMARRLREDYGWKRNTAYQAVLEALGGAN